MSDGSPAVASRLAGQSGLIMAGNAFTLLAGFPFQIYLARMLGAEQLGAFSLFDVIAQTVAAFAGLGLSYAMVRFIPEHAGSGQPRHVRQLLITAFSTTLLLGVCAGVAVAVLGARLADWLPELRPYLSLFPIAGAMALLAMLTGMSAQALRGFLDIRWMVFVASFLQLTLKIAIAVALLSLGWALRGYMIAVVASLLLAFGGMAWGLSRHLARLGHADDHVLPETRRMWWSYAYTMYASSLLGMAVVPVERFLIGGVLDLASLGIWTAVRMLQSLPQAFLQIVITVVAPMFVGAKGKDGSREVADLYRIGTDWVCRLAFPLLIFLATFGDQVLGLYGSQFSSAGYWALLILLVGQVVNLATGPVGAILYMLGQEKLMLRISLLSDGLFFAFLLVLTPALGLVGASAASALATICSNLAGVQVMRRQLGIRWWSARYRRLAVPIGICIAASLAADHIGMVHNAFALGLSLVATYAIFFVAYASRGLTSEDKAIYRSILGLAKDTRK